MAGPEAMVGIEPRAGPQGDDRRRLQKHVFRAEVELVDAENRERRLADALAEVRNAEIGFIFQTFNLLPVYTVFENVEFPLLLLGLPADERRRRVMQALDWVGLADRARSRPDQLSGGQCQRVAISRAVVKAPAVTVAASGAPGAPTTGASFMAVILMVTLAVPSSSAGPPEVPGSAPVLPESFTVTLNVALAAGVSELLR